MAESDADFYALVDTGYFDYYDPMEDEEPEPEPELTDEEETVNMGIDYLYEAIDKLSDAAETIRRSMFKDMTPEIEVLWSPLLAIRDALEAKLNEEIEERMKHA